jgi:hypothetical protein
MSTFMKSVSAKMVELRGIAYDTVLGTIGRARLMDHHSRKWHRMRLEMVRHFPKLFTPPTPLAVLPSVTYPDPRDIGDDIISDDPEEANKPRQSSPKADTEEDQPRVRRRSPRGLKRKKVDDDDDAKSEDRAQKKTDVRRKKVDDDDDDDKSEGRAQKKTDVRRKKKDDVPETSQKKKSTRDADADDDEMGGPSRSAKGIKGRGGKSKPPPKILFMPPPPPRQLTAEEAEAQAALTKSPEEEAAELMALQKRFSSTQVFPIFDCPYCKRPFIREDEQRNHILIAHAANCFQCDMCEFIAVSEGELVTHRRTKHRHEVVTYVYYYSQ